MRHSRNTTIVITAARKMQVTEQVQAKIIAALAFAPENTEVRVRARSDGKYASPVEYWVAGLHAILNDTSASPAWFLHVIKPAEKGPGCAWRRDRALVADAHRVIAFFQESNFMEGGTGHVVQCALDANVPVEAWAQALHGELELVAEDDNGIDHTETWLKSRAAAAMVLKFKETAQAVKLSGPSSLTSPLASESNTSSGSVSIGRTGGVRFQPASTSERSAVDSVSPSRLSSSPTSGT
jgi:hypothetical protein